MRKAGDTTLAPPRRGDAPQAELRALTILHHPDVRRTGERALLVPDATLELSRSGPLFAAAGERAGRALEDRYLSRQPTLITSERHSVRIAPTRAVPLAVEGEPVSAVTEYPAALLEQGLCLLVGMRVVLLLHRVEQASREDPPDFGLVGRSAPIQRVRRQIHDVAAVETGVLILGESGSGKELVARAIVNASGRAGKPFVVVNMAAIPPSTAASELFGHAPGAFTGAMREHRGYFEQAHGGTLFLDEIGATPPEAQAMLLRALETGDIQPLGSSRAKHVDVRVLAATDADLEDAVATERFRQALLHRLAAYSLHVPALRERREDIGLLTVHFLREELRAVGAEPLLDTGDPATPWLTAELMETLACHDWPGNVRELRNVVRQLAISCRARPQATLDPGLRRRMRPLTSAAAAVPSVRRTPSEITEDELIAALKAHQWRTRAAAAALGVSRATLIARIDRSERIRRARDVPLEELQSCYATCGGDLDAMSEALQVSRRGLLLRLRECRLA